MADDDQEERREIEAYLNQHQLQSFLGDAVNNIVKERPGDPLVRLADVLRACSQTSRQIQGVKGRQVLSGEGLPALEVQVSTCQGVSYGTVSLGPFDDEEEFYEGKGVMHALERVGHIVAEVVVGEDPSQQVEIDARLAQESSLPANVVSAASIACCKAGAKQGSVSVFDQIALVSNNSESGIPALAFSVINGGHLSSSSLWVQDILIVPTKGTTVSDSMLVSSTIHRTLEKVARDAGQELLQRGPRGGFCNCSGTFEQLMDCLVVALESSGCTGSVELVVDVHASRLVPREGKEDLTGEGERKQQPSYNLSTFCADKTGSEPKMGNALLDIYLEWLETYPITAFVEPFATADVACSKELLNRGHQILHAKTKTSPVEANDTPVGADGQAEITTQTGNTEGSSGEDKCLLTVIADESVLTPAQLVFVNEQRGANAVVVNTAKISTVSDCIALAGKANELGWSLLVSTSNEQELEGEFLADLAVGLRASQLLMGGLRSASTVMACARMARIENERVKL